MSKCGKIYIIVNQYFPNDECMMLQNRAWVEPFKVQNKGIEFNVTEQKNSSI